MADILLGIGDISASACAGDVLVTMALGSCVAIVARDPLSGAIGMAHIALPGAPEGVVRSPAGLPGYYADTAIPALFRTMERVGAPPAGRGLQIKLIGGATILDRMGSFNIGKRNVLGIKRVLWQYGLGSIAEDVGGELSRTVRAEVPSGIVRITSPGLPTWAV
jgi:chemotaxis protein CheD